MGVLRDILQTPQKNRIALLFPRVDVDRVEVLPDVLRNVYLADFLDVCWLGQAGIEQEFGMLRGNGLRLGLGLGVQAAAQEWFVLFGLVQVSHLALVYALGTLDVTT
jgi:hypothetical protein